MTAMTAAVTIPTAQTLTRLPSELLLHILSYLDVPDLLSLTRTSSHIRCLSLDPLLHVHRLHRASAHLSPFITTRPSLAELIHLRIYITRTTQAARRLGRELVRIKLNKKLASRPEVGELVGRGVLPGECFGRGEGMMGGGKVAPGLVERKRMVERERVRDFLRGWVEEWRRRGGEMIASGFRLGEEGEEKIEVRRIVRRFGNREREGRDIPIWGRRVVVKEAPTRAKVLGLRRFWEGIGRGSTVL